MVSRFVAEARAVNQIRHRNIIDIFSFGELPDGRQLLRDGVPRGRARSTRYIAQHGAMPLAEALPILRAVARALDAAHAKGIAHRDLKPENIFLARDADGACFRSCSTSASRSCSRPTDALATRTGTGEPMGTPYYMSPEQCRGSDVDHRTDIYSFGVRRCFALLTARYPFDGDVRRADGQARHRGAAAGLGDESGAAAGGRSRRSRG